MKQFGVAIVNPIFFFIYQNIKNRYIKSIIKKNVKKIVFNNIDSDC